MLAVTSSARGLRGWLGGKLDPGADAAQGPRRRRRRWGYMMDSLAVMHLLMISSPFRSQALALIRTKGRAQAAPVCQTQRALRAFRAAPFRGGDSRTSCRFLSTACQQHQTRLQAAPAGSMAPAPAAAAAWRARFSAWWLGSVWQRTWLRLAVQVRRPRGLLPRAAAAASCRCCCPPPLPPPACRRPAHLCLAPHPLRPAARRRASARC